MFFFFINYWFQIDKEGAPLLIIIGGIPEYAEGGPPPYRSGTQLLHYFKLIFL